MNQAKKDKIKNKNRKIVILLLCAVLSLGTACGSQSVSGDAEILTESGLRQEGSADAEQTTADGAPVGEVAADGVASGGLTSDGIIADVTTAEETESEDQGIMEPSVKVRGIYVTGPVAGSGRMSELTELVNSTELNTMVIDIKNDDGNITYKMELPYASDMGACVRYVADMPALIDSLHEQGIYVIGRIVCFKDPVLAKAHPELALCKPDGTAVTDANGLAWVNPYKQEVWDYLCQVAEQATKDGFDEIQFDYVRFPIGDDANAADYGVNMDEYTREAGLEDFFEYMEERLHESGIIVGADLFGTVIGSDVDRARTGQNYVTIAEKTDVLSPMIYPSHYAAGTFGLDVPDARPYETITSALQLSQSELGGSEGKKAVVRPWLQCFTAIWVKGHIDYDSDAVRSQIQAVYDAGYDEWILWNASNHYEQVEEALEGLTSAD